ncbi:MAG: helix-turn-helix domain-containing protein [Peptococcaceae bacterium]|nr:helix-turn-helix domain-containing protein [Peptococcaceae bacterium]
MRNNIKALRLAAGLTQSRLAAALGISVSALSYYEVGKRRLSPELLCEFARFFSVSIDSLFQYDGKVAR